nr:MAG TPA: hypothetical protein [Caudoviricetes sp.]
MIYPDSLFVNTFFRVSELFVFFSSLCVVFSEHQCYYENKKEYNYLWLRFLKESKRDCK